MQAWKTMDVERLKSIWDRDYDNFIYIALELARPVRDWNGIEKYYERVPGQFETVTHMSIDDLSIEVLGDVAFAYCTFHFESKFKGQSEPHTAGQFESPLLHQRGTANRRYRSLFEGKQKTNLNPCGKWQTHTADVRSGGVLIGKAPPMICTEPAEPPSKICSTKSSPTTHPSTVMSGRLL